MPVSHEVMEIIRRKKAQHGRYMDTKQWDKFQELFLPHASLTFLDPAGAIVTAGSTKMAFSSAADFARFFARFWAQAQTLHMFGPGDLEQTASDEVRAIWSMEDQMIMNATGGMVHMRGGGYYYETWKMSGGDWFLKDLSSQWEVAISLQIHKSPPAPSPTRNLSPRNNISAFWTDPNWALAWPHRNPLSQHIAQTTKRPRGTYSRPR
ncbi:hypothetical protein D0Z07_3766 [Hyphodiscus hymeniophilus]|uniref:SnoaL-like domain-containing protein n=1 Tax=Hyphodiscus hymeniophilus TaxID=353542 RepID=A0A9P6VLD5_9HELO|nr:hypothetical protein D0Z07_3766 [Hyphodiscus hymeniophilus]